MSGLMLSRRTKLGAGGAFSPDQIAGLQLWLKADSLALADGDPVATWTDSSTNARNVDQAAAAKRPVYKASVMNAKPAVLFDGVDDILANTTSNPFAQTDPSTVFVAGKVDATSNGGTPLYVRNSDSVRGFLFWRSDPVMYYGTDGVANNVSKNPADDRTVLRAGFVGTTRTTYTGTKHRYEVFLNGTQVALTDTDIDPETGTAGFTVGGRHSGFNPWFGHLAEILAYNVALSTADRQAIEGHLKEKYATP